MEDSQSLLSERLRLLYEFRHTWASQVVREPKKEPEKSKARIKQYRVDEKKTLDNLCVALATGRPGEVFAATLRKEKHMCIVLAKGSSVTQEDIDYADELLSVVMAQMPAPWHGYQHVFPLLVRRCGALMNKRIRALHENLSHGREGLLDMMKLHSPSSRVEDEFGTSVGWELLQEIVQKFHGNFHQIMTHLIDCTIEKSTMQVDSENIHQSLDNFKELAAFAEVLRKCTLFQKFLEGEILFDPPQWYLDTINRLLRKLHKVTQYFVDISHAITVVRKYFLGLNRIPHEWIMDVLTDSGEGHLSLTPNIAAVLEHELSGPLTPKLAEILDRLVPDLVGNWTLNCNTTTFVHPELRIIQKYGRRAIFSTEPYGPVIGVCRRSCLCCKWWVSAYNQRMETKWRITRFGDYVRPDWALPGHACLEAVDANGRAVVDEYVHLTAETCLSGILQPIETLASRETSDSSPDELDEVIDAVEYA